MLVTEATLPGKVAAAQGAVSPPEALSDMKAEPGAKDLTR